MIKIGLSPMLIDVIIKEKVPKKAKKMTHSNLGQKG